LPSASEKPRRSRTHDTLEGRQHDRRVELVLSGETTASIADANLDGRALAAESCSGGLSLRG